MAQFEPIAGQTDPSDQLQAETLVVGGGIAGMTAAIEIAELGKKVILVERSPFLGGRVTAMNQYFPKLCPPTCGMEINLKRMRANPNIQILTLAEVDSVSGSPGNYETQIKLNPRYVNEKCTCCGDCEKVCEIERDDEFNHGIDKTKAIYLPHLMSYPNRYVVDPKHAGDDRMKKCVEACSYGAIDLDMQERTITASVGAIVWATGWKPYDATKIKNLGFGRYPNVIIRQESHPRGGKYPHREDHQDGSRPGGSRHGYGAKHGRGITKIGFVQCAGSRDENHLPYCSAVCCLASMKQATYVRERYPEAQIHLFYIDVRSPGRMEDFYTKVQEDENFFFHRGKVGKITETSDKNLILEAENTLTGRITRMEVDLAVLATGMVPNTAAEPPPLDTARDEFGFLVPGSTAGAIGAGVAVRPADVATVVQDGTSAALKAINAARQ
jgi:quinone-modifying oxidoreductase subunit QmoA